MPRRYVAPVKSNVGARRHDDLVRDSVRRKSFREVPRRRAMRAFAARPRWPP